jgi:23S rRNA (pseudouridine1915-N3)-methyltransferase
LKIRLIAVGTRMPGWIKEGFADYAERMPRECGLELVEIPVAERGKNADIARLKRSEAERILKAIPRDAQIVAFDERGETLSTEQWAQALRGWLQHGRDVALLIGGPDGFAPEVIEKAGRKWALSRLTLPHGLARVLVAEQLYRAWTRVTNHPYHRP